MQRSILASAIATLGLAAATQASFVPADWTISSSGTTGGGGITIDPSKALFVSPDAGVGGGQFTATWFYTGGGPISFTWDVIGLRTPGALTCSSSE